MAHLYAGGLSMAAISRRLSVPPSTVRLLLIRAGVELRTRSETARRRELNATPLPNPVLDIIEGELLGDGTLQMSKHQAYFRLRTSDVEYARWLLELLRSHQIPIADCGRAKEEKHLDKSGVWRTAYVVRTRSLAHLAQLYRRWYPQGLKIVPENLQLTPAHLLHWWIGDGTVRSKGCSAMFCTDNFSATDHGTLMKELQHRFGLRAHVVRERGRYPRLFLPSQACDLISQIGHPPPFFSVSHKWDVRPPRCSQRKKERQI